MGVTDKPGINPDFLSEIPDDFYQDLYGTSSSFGPVSQLQISQALDDLAKHNIDKYLHILSNHSHSYAVSQYIKSKQDSSLDLTLPGMNYMGPGTKIIENLLDHKVPTSYNDYVAMQHDIAYLDKSDDDAADTKAIRDAELITPTGLSPSGLLLTTGLGARVIADKLAHLFNSHIKLSGRSDTLPITTEQLQQLLTQESYEIIPPGKTKDYVGPGTFG